MLQVFGFNQIGVVIGDLYFVDPRPDPGQEGAERGVRLEVRFIEAQPSDGSIYAARPILIGPPVWRADLLESVDGEVGSHDRTHHHPRMRGWEPGSRQFDPKMSADPLRFVGDQLADLDALLAGAGIDPSTVDGRDSTQLRQAAPQIVASVRGLLDAVAEGQLAEPPEDLTAEVIRTGWL